MSKERERRAESKGRKIGGILGGMGPEATVDLMSRVIAHTESPNDTGHVRLLVDQNPQVPSRITALLDGTASPGPCLIEMARDLESQGADFLCIPCNTAHYWLKDIAASVAVPVLDMLAIAAKDALSKIDGAQKTQDVIKIGILGTPATSQNRLYSPACTALGAEAIYPDADGEAALLELINTIKARRHGPDSGAALTAVGASLRARGAKALIVACTELGILGPEPMEAIGLPFVDACDALACAIVRESGAQFK